MVQPLHTLPGLPYPLGATVQADGVNFVLFTKNATGIELLLFDAYDDPTPAHVIPFDPETNHTFYYWHILVQDIGPGQIYAYRVDGPYIPEQGLRFYPNKVLLDPYAKAIVYGDNWSHQQARGFGNNTASAMKCVVVDESDYDWEGDRPLQRSIDETIIYEMHVGGVTRHPSSGTQHPGTFTGITEKIPYLQSLGITAVELMPVQQFDEQDIASTRPLTNYWGYNPINFFAPHRGYCIPGARISPINQFRDMVKALHRAGIEVILDVVFNHTAEGNENGPTICYRGLENRAYYLLDHNDRSRYKNYTGCGNTLNGNHSIVRRLIMDALHYWVQEMHVDGFRFDLASVLSRDELGRPMRDPPILWDIESDPHLAGAKIIAEAWDAAGLYQVGTFIGHRWAEWNGRYRDDVRRFLRGDEGTVQAFAARVLGSPDIYTAPDHVLHRSINFITCHDGFTLNDWVSFNRKHNEANGENNRDGLDENWSWNHGIEGPTTHPQIEALREQQIKNALATLLVSQGTPMLLSGDEVRHTQGGNNNAYCQNNEISWFNWNDVDRQQELLRFTRRMIHFNRQHPALNLKMYPATSSAVDNWVFLSVHWHGVKLNQPDWSYYSHSIAMTLSGAPYDDDDIHIVFNAYWEDLEFELPPRPAGSPWQRAVDTALPSPQDIAEPGEEPEIKSKTIVAKARSVIVLIAHNTGIDEANRALEVSRTV
ncbi:MAG: glycogen debranching protein GlgX [Anaerolineae bacterium]|nr:glycogen debranching protein GlgX [Anaerolineae bacterium]